MIYPVPEYRESIQNGFLRSFELFSSAGVALKTQSLVVSRSALREQWERFRFFNPLLDLMHFRLRQAELPDSRENRLRLSSTNRAQCVPGVQPVQTPVRTSPPCSYAPPAGKRSYGQLGNLADIEMS